MTPRIGDDEKLRQILLAAKKAAPFDRFAQVAPLIEGLQESIESNARAKELMVELLATIRQYPTYSHDMTMGSEPVAVRWMVSKPERFHKVAEKIRQEFGL